MMKTVVVTLLFLHKIEVLAVSPDSYFDVVSEAAGVKATEVLYANFKKHCDTTGSQFAMEGATKTYSVFGSVPKAQSSPYTSPTSGNLLSEYTSPTICSFVISAPSGSRLKINFDDPKCNSWPAVCQVMIFDGNIQQSGASKRILTSVPSMGDFSDTKCQQEVHTSGPAVSATITNCVTVASASKFNFSITVSKVAAEVESGSSDQPSLTVIAIAVIVPLMVIGAVTGCLIWRFVMKGATLTYTKRAGAVSPRSPSVPVVVYNNNESSRHQPTPSVQIRGATPSRGIVWSVNRDDVSIQNDTAGLYDNALAIHQSPPSPRPSAPVIEQNNSRRQMLGVTGEEQSHSNNDSDEEERRRRTAHFTRSRRRPSTTAYSTLYDMPRRPRLSIAKAYAADA